MTHYANACSKTCPCRLVAQDAGGLHGGRPVPVTFLRPQAGLHLEHRPTEAAPGSAAPPELETIAETPRRINPFVVRPNCMEPSGATGRKNHRSLLEPR